MKRLNFLIIFFSLFSLAIVFKLFFLQVVMGDKLATSAENQHFSALDIPAERGKILSSDLFPLVMNQKVFLVYATIPDIKGDKKEIAEKLAPLFVEEDTKSDLKPEEAESSASSQMTQEASSEKSEKEYKDKLAIEAARIEDLLGLNDLIWVPLKRKMSLAITDRIKSLSIEGLGFEEEQKRSYPEASGSASLLGFVGADSNGIDKGYFGLEGFYNGELKGRSGRLREEVDAEGRPILVGSRVEVPPEDGRDLVLSIDRGAQFIVERKLKEGVAKFGAKSGSVLMMDPKTGAVLADASFPGFDPGRWEKYNPARYRNPTINDVFEPGSTFKVITASAALDVVAVDQNTRCPCTGPRKIGPFEIKTWNNKYYPNSSLAEILQHSDNVGTVFVSEKLGLEKFLDYVYNFGFGKTTVIDLEGEATGILHSRSEWQPIDHATASFGQGHSVTMVQMVNAVSAIANGGELMQPQVVSKIVGKDRTVEIKPRVTRRVIKRETASTMTELMVNAVENGEARYFVPKGYRIAGKTGTAQVPVEGHYDPTKTIASFIGFAPADDPKFVMLVKIDEPKSSPWGSETAAPLFFDIAKELFTYWGLPPNQ